MVESSRQSLQPAFRSLQGFLEQVTFNEVLGHILPCITSFQQMFAMSRWQNVIKSPALGREGIKTKQKFC